MKTSYEILPVCLGQRVHLHAAVNITKHDNLFRAGASVSCFELRLQCLEVNNASPRFEIDGIRPQAQSPPPQALKPSSLNPEPSTHNQQPSTSAHIHAHGPARRGDDG